MTQPPQYPQRPPYPQAPPQYGPPQAAPPQYGPPPMTAYGPPPGPPPKKGPNLGLIFGGVAGVIVVVAVIVTLVIALTGKPSVNPVISGPSGESVPGTNDANLTVSLDRPISLLPGNAGYAGENAVITALYAGLTRTDPATGMPVNRIAESITTTDSKLWTIKLRPGFTFHNGEPVTARSFVDAWNYAADDVNLQAGSYAFQNIAGFAEAQKDAAAMSGLQVLDDRTFTVTLTAPWAAFPTGLAMPVMSPMAAECLASTTACDQHPIGNGPFRLQTGSLSDGLSLTRWDGFAGDKPQYGGITFQFTSDPAMNEHAVIAGSADMARFGRTAASSGTTTVTKPTGRFVYLGFPTAAAPYKSADLRRAISLSLDREAIAKAVPGLAPATSFTPAGLPGHKDGSCSDCRYDPAGAKALFTSSGWDPKTPIEFTYSQYNGTASYFLPLACAQITAALGVQCKSTQLDGTAFAGKLSERSFETGWASGWLPDQASAESYLTPLYGKGNYFGYTDAAYEQSLATANAMTSLETAVPFYQEAEAKLNAGMPLVPVAFDQYVAGIGPRVVAGSIIVDPASETPQWDLLKVKAN